VIVRAKALPKVTSGPPFFGAAPGRAAGLPDLVSRRARATILPGFPAGISGFISTFFLQGKKKFPAAAYKRLPG